MQVLYLKMCKVQITNARDDPTTVVATPLLSDSRPAIFHVLHRRATACAVPTPRRVGVRVRVRIAIDVGLGLGRHAR